MLLEQKFSVLGYIKLSHRQRNTWKHFAVCEETVK